jgi:hypothetical protein
MQGLQAKMPDVQFAGVVVRGDRDDARKLIRKRGWSFPIAYDRDGAIANIYGIAVCPETLFVYPGRILRGTAIGKGVADDLPRRVDALVAGARRRGWRPPA